MSSRDTQHLRVLIANERRDRLALVAADRGCPRTRGDRPRDRGRRGRAGTARERPDVALVGLGESSQHALHLIERIVKQAFCPVILLIHEPNPGFVREASRRGIFAYIDGESVDEASDWQSSIDIVLRRFAEYHDLQGAFGRRALTERAKGILMERHAVGEEAAFELLRDDVRTTITSSPTSPARSSTGTRCCPSRRPSQPTSTVPRASGDRAPHRPGTPPNSRPCKGAVLAALVRAVCCCRYGRQTGVSAIPDSLLLVARKMA